jgi:DNA-directed RNA polymerase specialized sigma subunit
MKAGSEQWLRALSLDASLSLKHQRQEALARKQNGEPLTEIAKSYNVSHMTISRLQVDYRESI